MIHMGRKIALFFLVALPLQAADDSSNDRMMKAAVMMEGGGKFSNSEKTLFKQSIRSAKENVARETLDVFYRDALDAYYRSRYDEALELLNNISAVDPYYEDVATLKETITRIKYSRDIQSKRGILDDYMKQGNEARKEGRNVQAISFWKQALTVNPNYRPALKKIEEVNKEMARSHYEEGYRNYKAQDYEQAYDNWSNAIALDPSLKDRGLLQMLSKTQITLQKGQTSRLNAQASQLYADGNYYEAFQIYEQILKVEPRNEEARRMTAKLRLKMGATTFSAAQKAQSARQFDLAIRNWQESIRYGYEVEKSEAGIKQAEQSIRAARLPRKPVVATPKASTAPAANAGEGDSEEPGAPAQPKQVANPEEANKHYRLGLAAIRSKDYHHALEELELASRYDPDNEHIYVARERARQEWKQMNTSKGGQ